MDDVLKSLLELVTNGALLKPAMFERIADENLDNRYVPDFEDEWLRINNELEKKYDSEQRKTFAEICKQAYIISFKATNSDEIAALISDDFDLFAKAVVADYDDPWLASLFQCYVDGCFPTGKLAPAKANLKSAIK